MIIKEAKYKECKKCGRREIKSREEYGCDQCKKPISFDSAGNRREYHDISIFYNEGETKHLQFCSWICCLRFLRNIQQSKWASNYFCALPYLHFDNGKDGLSYWDFFDAIKTIAAEDISESSQTATNSRSKKRLK